MTKYKVLKEFIDPDFTWYKAGEIFTPKSSLMIDALKSAKFIEEIEEPTRWRAPFSCAYYFVGTRNTSKKLADTTTVYDDELYESRNYFRTEETTQLVADAQKLFFEWLHTPPRRNHRR